MKLGIVIGSVREGRVTDRLAKWVASQAKTIEGIEPKIIDLKNVPMPLFDEALSPQSNQNRQPKNEVKIWLDAVNDCDAIALVTPEYNRSLSAALKNALDYLDFQLKRKPVLLVAHGSTGGAQAVSHLRAILPGVLAITVPPAVMIVGPVGSKFDEEGNINDDLKANPYGPQAALTNALNELKWYSDSLAAGRH